MLGYLLLGKARNHKALCKNLFFFQQGKFSDNICELHYLFYSVSIFNSFFICSKFSLSKNFLHLTLCMYIFQDLVIQRVTFGLDWKLFIKLTSLGHSTLRFDLKNDKDTYGFAEYPGTKVHSEATEYRITLGPHSGSIGNGMFTATEEKFSSWDNDNDKNYHWNCAEFLKGGWWYYECFYSGLNGLFYNESNSNPDHMSWPNWGPFYGGIKFSEMKVRRN